MNLTDHMVDSIVGSVSLTLVALMGLIGFIAWCKRTSP